PASRTARRPAATRTSIPRPTTPWAATSSSGSPPTSRAVVHHQHPWGGGAIRRPFSLDPWGGGAIRRPFSLGPRRRSDQPPLLFGPGTAQPSSAVHHGGHERRALPADDHAPAGRRPRRGRRGPGRIARPRRGHRDLRLRRRPLLSPRGAARPRRPRRGPAAG